MTNRDDVDAAPVQPMVRRHVRLSRDGLPVDPRDWTRADWQDLHNAMEKAKRAIRKRHKAEK